jgi:hypothetical protein
MSTFKAPANFKQSLLCRRPNTGTLTAVLKQQNESHPLLCTHLQAPFIDPQKYPRRRLNTNTSGIYYQQKHITAQCTRIPAMNRSLIDTNKLIMKRSENAKLFDEAAYFVPTKAMAEKEMLPSNF